MSSSVAQSALEHLSFFDDMMSTARIKRRPAVEQPAVNTKFLFKRDGFEAGVNKKRDTVAASKAVPAKGADARKRSKPESVPAGQESDDEDEESGEEVSDDDDDDEGGDGSTPKDAAKAAVAAAIAANKNRLVPLNYAGLNELKARLHAKVEASRVINAAGEGKRAVRRAKKAEATAAKKAREAAKKKGAAAAAAAFKAEGAEASKIAKGSKHQQKARHGDAERTAASEAREAAMSDLLPKRAPDASKLKTDAAKIPIAFSFGTTTTTKAAKAFDVSSDSPAARGSGGIGAKIAKMNEFKQHLTHLRETGRGDEADAQERAAKVDVALKRASGTTVITDEKKLEKIRKLNKNKKEKSKKLWEDRQGSIAKAQRERQEKRNANIQSRIQQKKDWKKGIRPTPASRGGRGGSRGGRGGRGGSSRK